MSEKSRFLITTADERSWKYDRRVLFLGEWCRIYSRSSVWTSLDAKLMDRSIDWTKRVDQYEYLHGLCEDIFASLASKLNRIHNVDHGTRYWRIFLAPWVYFIIPTLFDRWHSIKKAFTEYDISGSVVLNFGNERLVPGGPHDMVDYMISDEWNHTLCSNLLEHFFGTERWEYLDVGGSRVDVTHEKQPVGRKESLYRSLSSFFPSFSRSDDFFVSGTYLPLLNEKVLEMMLGQPPHLWSRNYRYKDCTVDWSSRNWHLDFMARDEFETYVVSSVSRLLPFCYVEGYAGLCDAVALLPWPRKPRAVYTSNILWYDTLAMMYVADNIEKGVPLVYGQHGGHYGMGLNKWIEEHEINISDRYLTWGWGTAESGRNSKKLVPLGMQKKMVRKKSKEVAGDLLFVMASAPRYPFRLDMDAEIYDYLVDCFRLPDALAGTPIYNSLLVRLYSRDYGWNEKARWSDAHPTIRLDDGMASMDELIERSKLVVYSYNSTGYLESLVSNIPCVVLFDELLSPLRDDAKPYFDELHRVGVYQKSPESAVEHIQKIWEDIPAWWDSPEVQSVLEKFKKQYCAHPGHLLGRIKGVLKDVVEEKRRTEQVEA